MSSTEAFALRYSSRPECSTSEAFYRHDLYAEQSTTIGMDYFFWVLRSRGQTVVVDCGFDESVARQRNRQVDTPPFDLLREVGVDPQTVDHVVLSHMHFDHVGNTNLFPSATFYMAQAEYEYWSGPSLEVPAFSWPVESSEVALIESLVQEERLQLVGDTAEIGTTGVRVTRYPGHTPGQLVTELDTGRFKTVLASDAAHYYDEISRNRPFYLFSDLSQLLASYAELRALAALPHVNVIPGHDPEVTRRYQEVAPNCFDLTQAIPREAVCEGQEIH